MSLSAKTLKKTINIICADFTSTRVAVFKQRSGNSLVLGPRSSIGENSGGPMKPLIVPFFLSSKNSCKEPLYGDSYVEKIILGPVKVLEDQ